MNNLFAIEVCLVLKGAQLTSDSSQNKPKDGFKVQLVQNIRSFF